jgi:hypothetical protein
MALVVWLKTSAYYHTQKGIEVKEINRRRGKGYSPGK